MNREEEQFSTQSESTSDEGARANIYRYDLKHGLNVDASRRSSSLQRSRQRPMSRHRSRNITRSASRPDHRWPSVPGKTSTAGTSTQNEPHVLIPPPSKRRPIRAMAGTFGAIGSPGWTAVPCVASRGWEAQAREPPTLCRPRASRCDGVRATDRALARPSRPSFQRGPLGDGNGFMGRVDTPA
jgi:hypothetical protein